MNVATNRTVLTVSILKFTRTNAWKEEMWGERALYPSDIKKLRDVPYMYPVSSELIMFFL